MNIRSIRYALYLVPITLGSVLAGCGSSDDDNAATTPPANVAPTVNAGADQVAVEGDIVTLAGTSADSDGQILSRIWRQTGGEPVEFSQTGGVLTLPTPDIQSQQTYQFELTVTDNRAAAASDSVSVTVDQIKFFGVAAAAAGTYDDFLSYFDQITPENAAKWGSVEATRDVMVWTQVDTAYEFAKANHIPFKFHALIWGQQQPAWIAALPAEEQLEEINEWMAAVAERYPDIESIDVVNEPINAPAGYREALGGAGETGYDWVITSFEMAREYFPGSILILNEYNTLMLEQFTTNYIEIIELLQERGLIDAVGEQAHFLERTEPEVVAANLDALAATGLPIYISEFDLNYLDDARQANAMRDLFPIFWDHPAVAGVTHWGYKQGTMWRPNAFLQRTDGSARPAFDFVNCYIGGGGDTCTVPEYVPAGWQGTATGVTMEAELYDEGQGVAAIGSVVAYTDEGDWIAFSDVDFHQDWNTFWVTYSKGNTAAASISVYLDDPASTEVFTLDLPSTGGWGSSDTLEQAWLGVTGIHDVYIRFNGEVGEGVANIDSVRFGKPLPQSGLNLLTNGGFEAGITGWSAWNGSTLSASTAQAHEGTQSLFATARPSDAQFAVYNVTSLVQADTTYAVSAWVFHTGGGNQTVRLASKLECSGSAATYPWLQNNTAVVPNTWTQLSGNLIIPAGCTVTDAAIFLEGPAAGVDVYVDEVKLIPPDSNLVTDGGFESGIAGWASWNGSTLAASTAQKHSGAQSLLASARPNANQFAVYSLTGKVTAETTYVVSAWVYQTGAASQTVRLASKLSCSGSGDTYPWLQNNTAVVPNTWTQLTGNLAIPAGCTVTDAAIFLEGTPVGANVYVDDVSATEL